YRKAPWVQYRQGKHSPGLADRFRPVDRFLAVGRAEPFEREAFRPVATGGDLVGRRRMRHQLAAFVPPQCLRSEPANSLEEPAFELTAIKRRIERAANVVQHIDRDNTVLDRKS